MILSSAIRHCQNPLEKTVLPERANAGFEKHVSRQVFRNKKQQTDLNVLNCTESKNS
jgi:hypothetical protein